MIVIGKHKKKLLYLLLFLASITLVTGLVLYALRQNINLYYTPQQLLVAENVLNRRIRIGGLVMRDSIKFADDLKVMFIITDFKNNIAVEYSGILPDLFRENQGVVAAGILQANNIFIAEQILAKHDEKYISKVK